MTLQEIKSAAMELSPRDREILAEELLLSFTEDDRMEVEEAWLTEAARRTADYKAGKSPGKDVDEVINRLRAKGRS